MHHPTVSSSAAYVAQEEKAMERLLALGVTVGAPVTLPRRDRQAGHTGCAFHLIITSDGYDVDGGAASTLLTLLTDGTYGNRAASDYTLIPCN